MQDSVASTTAAVSPAQLEEVLARGGGPTGTKFRTQVKLKLKYQGTTRVVKVSESYSFAELQKRLREDYQFDVLLNYEDSDGDKVILNSQNDLNELLDNEDGPVHVQVSVAKEPEPLPLPPPSAGAGKALGHFMQQPQQQQQQQPQRQGQREGQHWHPPQHGGGGGDGGASFPDAEMVQELTQADRWRSRGQQRRVQPGTSRGRGGAGSGTWRKGSDEDPVRWLCGDVIGEGAFGTVYMGLNLETGELMAVKSITLDQGDLTSGDAKSFHNEVGILRDNKHDNIVRYYGSGVKDNNLSIFLEYMPGGSVRRLLNRFGVFEDKITLIYTAQIMRGLEFLHSNGVAHRDIKAANCLVDQRGSIKLADFGMSKRMVGLAGTGNAEVQSVKGTPFWMAPEVLQVKDLRDGWKKADVWSLGATILEMATGSPPWEPIGPMAAMFKISCTKDIPAIPDEVSEEVQDVVQRCLTRDPDERPTVSQLLTHPPMSQVGPQHEPMRREPSFQFTAVPKAARMFADPQDSRQQPRQHADDVGRKPSGAISRTFDGVPSIAEAREDSVWTTSSETGDSAATTLAAAGVTTSGPVAGVAPGAMAEEQVPWAAGTEPLASTASSADLLKPPYSPAAASALDLLTARPLVTGRKQRIVFATTSMTAEVAGKRAVGVPCTPDSELSSRPICSPRRARLGLGTHLEGLKEMSASSGIASSITSDESQWSVGERSIQTSKTSDGATRGDDESCHSGRLHLSSPLRKKWGNLGGGIRNILRTGARFETSSGLPTDLLHAEGGGAGGGISIEGRVDFGEQLGEGSRGGSDGGSRKLAVGTGKPRLRSSHPAGPGATSSGLDSNASWNREDEAAASIAERGFPLHQTRHSTRSPQPVAARPAQAAADGGPAPAGKATPLVAREEVVAAATVRGARSAPSTVPSVPSCEHACREDSSGGALGGAGDAKPLASPRVHDTYAAGSRVGGQWSTDHPRPGRWPGGTSRAGRSGSWSPGGSDLGGGRGSPIPMAKTVSVSVGEGASAGSPLPLRRSPSSVCSSVSPCVPTRRKSTFSSPKKLSERDEEEMNQSPQRGSITPYSRRASTGGAEDRGSADRGSGSAERGSGSADRGSSSSTKPRDSSGCSSGPGGSSSALGGSSGAPVRNFSVSGSFGTFGRFGEGGRGGGATYRSTRSVCSSGDEPSLSLQSMPGLTARAEEWKRRIRARSRHEEETKDKTSSASSPANVGSSHSATPPGLEGDNQRSARSTGSASSKKTAESSEAQRVVSPASERHPSHRHQPNQQHPRSRNQRFGSTSRSPPLMRSSMFGHDGTGSGGRAKTGSGPSAAARYGGGGGGSGGGASIQSISDHASVGRDSPPSVTGVGMSGVDAVPRGGWAKKAEGVAADRSPSESEHRLRDNSKTSSEISRRSSASAAIESKRGRSPSSNRDRAIFDLLTTTPKPGRTSSGSELRKSSRAASLRRHSLPSFPPRSPSPMDRDPAQARSGIMGRAGNEVAGRTEGLARGGDAENVFAGQAEEDGHRDGAAGRADPTTATAGTGEEKVHSEGQQIPAVVEDKDGVRDT